MSLFSSSFNPPARLNTTANDQTLSARASPVLAASSFSPPASLNTPANSQTLSARASPVFAASTAWTLSGAGADAIAQPASLSGAQSHPLTHPIR
ncbi:MAG: hypothetical protein K8963_03685 [Proteobacteria bacterium]|nr:hypothetical protein [Pseudomonadota bacterium]